MGRRPGPHIRPEGQPEDQNGERLCRECGEWKPLEKFVRKHSTSPHRSWVCMACTSRAARERKEYGFKEGFAHPDTVGERWCAMCDSYKPFDQFSFERVDRPGRSRKRKRNCNSCRNAARRDKYRATIWDGSGAFNYPLDTETKRWCSSCERFKPFDDFYEYGRRSQRKGQRHRICKTCFVAKVKAREKINPSWNSKILSREEFEAQLAAQDGQCYLCGREQTHKAKYGAIKRLAIDHDHDHCEQGCPECFRKLLCDSCNQGLGLFQDNPKLLRKAADYIEEHRRLQDQGVPPCGRLKEFQIKEE